MFRVWRKEKLIRNIIKELKKPFYAFSVEFETCVFYHHVGIKEIFERELNLEIGGLEPPTSAMRTRRSPG